MYNNEPLIHSIYIFELFFSFIFDNVFTITYLKLARIKQNKQ